MSDLTQLPLEELLEQIQDNLYGGNAEPVVAGVHELLRRGLTPYDALTQGLIAGMDVVGEDFRTGKLFVPQVLMAAKAMKAGMEMLRPLLAETGAPRIGTLVIGTVKGDIHDIGKNLVGMMMEGAGFQVVNLGINTDVEKFLHAVREHAADILGMSALLTTTMPYMRDRHPGAQGGRPPREADRARRRGAAQRGLRRSQIGADAYCRDAAKAVETAKRLMAEKMGGSLA